MTPTMLTKVLINLAIFIVLIIGSWIYLKRLKFNNKGYKLLFIVYTLFWIAPMLLRSYAGTLQNIIDVDYTWIVLASYGLVGIVGRVFADYLNFSFKSRKSFLYLSCLLQVIFYLPVIIMPNTATSIIQSIGVGIGASCIGSFQLLFKEQYNKTESYLTVSLLAIPPLLANFLTAPLQSMLVSIAHTSEITVDVNILKYMWLIGLMFTVITFVIIFFVKEDKAKFNSIKQKEFIFKSDGINLIILCVLGCLISFVKFSNSGSVGTLHLQTLARLSGENSSAYEGYLSVIFSLFQLFGSVLIGFYLVKKYSSLTIFLGGCMIWIIYTISIMFITNPLGYFFIHGLNGFAYGILYNFVLGAVLSTQFKKNKITPMGIYQSILSIGIAVSGVFTQLLKNNLSKNFYDANIIIDSVLIGCIVLMSIVYFVNYQYIDKHKFIINDNTYKEV